MGKAAPHILHRIEQAKTQKGLQRTPRLASRVRAICRAADRSEALSTFERHSGQAIRRSPAEVPDRATARAGLLARPETSRQPEETVLGLDENLKGL